MVVSNIKAANELCPSLDVYDPGSIKVNLDILLTSLNNIDVSGIKQHYGFSAFLAETQINILNDSLNEIENSNNKNKK